MEALVLERKDELSLRDIAVDEPLGPRDVRIKLHTVGVCGSDVHYYSHGRIGPFVVEEPMILATMKRAAIMTASVPLAEKNAASTAVRSSAAIRRCCQASRAPAMATAASLSGPPPAATAKAVNPAKASPWATRATTRAVRPPRRAGSE